ncbi:MAG: transglycosylase SLT domain-containing protein, partial [Bacteroidales bacterium]|nr:transglycosylase SLT domain-containing protein [Bacteroidales bacterium]
TEPIAETRQVLVQKKPDNWRDLTISELDSQLIRKPEELARKMVYVQEGSAHTELLREISKETGIRIHMAEVPFEAERLIRMVATGDIDYAVCDENIAMVNSTYYPDIDVSTSLSQHVNLAWGIRKNNSSQLLEALNSWIGSFRKTSAYALIYAKYFNNSRMGVMFTSDYFALNTGRISQWDDLIKMYSDSIRWDWRLLASLIYQESRFIPDVVSAAGAYGLMQIMPETARHFGIDITSSPKNNIKAGTSYINWLHKIFDPKIEDESERLKFILAAYNAGPGHVLDAMKLAEKNGMDPQKWEDNVAVWLQKKSEPKYYNDDDVKSGYFRGKESIAFVSQILDRYSHYRNILPSSPEAK